MVKRWCVVALLTVALFPGTPAVGAGRASGAAGDRDARRGAEAARGAEPADRRRARLHPGRGGRSDHRADAAESNAELRRRPPRLRPEHGRDHPAPGGRRAAAAAVPPAAGAARRGRRERQSRRSPRGGSARGAAPRGAADVCVAAVPPGATAGRAGEPRRIWSASSNWCGGARRRRPKPVRRAPHRDRDRSRCGCRP